MPENAPPFRTASLLVVLLSLLPLTAAHAQLGADDTQPELPGAEEADPLPTPPGRVLRPIPIPTDDPAAELFAGGQISVRGFRFVGNVALSDERLNEVVASYVGEGRRYGALLEARDRVTRAYVDAGYISSGAVLSDEPIRDGIVEIRIIEGQLTTIEVESDGRLRDHYLASRLGLEGRGEALNLNSLRRRLRILKRDPNIESIASELAPGPERGDSILTVRVTEPIGWNASAEADDYVTPAIGGYRGRFAAGYRNLTGWGEYTNAAYSIAEGLHDLDVRLSAPVTRWDTVIEIRTRQAWSEITESPLDDFDVESRTQAYSIRVLQPVRRERTHSIGVFLAGEWKRGKSTLLGGLALSLDPQDDGRSTVSAIRGGIDGWWRGRSRAFSGRITVSQGLDILAAGSDTLNLSGNFTSGLFQLQGVEYLPWFGIRILTRVDGQVADDRLLGLEQFAAGGHASVRGYRENLLVRDEGVAGSIEIRIPLPTLAPIERLELGVFGDGGYARSHSSKSGDRLGAVGLGLHADITRFVRASIQWAESLNDPTGNLVGNHLQDDGVHFSLRIGFP